MECPKCKNEVGENELICPHCKKVLKLKCPKCGTINKGNVCKKCGFTIVVKCHECGKVNPTINGKCSKCGFSTYTSVAIGSSNIDEFACLTIEFPNLEDIRSVLKSTKLTEKFKNNLNMLIANYCGEIGTSREILEDVYVVRFNKDDTFKDSCINATKAAIEILQQIGDLNFKLEKSKNILLECKIAILKRDIYAVPEDYKSGFDIKLISESKKEFKYINCLQIITDQSINEQICDEFDLSTLSSSCIKGQMVMFFELNLKKHLNLKPPKEEDEVMPAQLAKLNDIPEVEQDETFVREERLYNEKDSITFSELKCDFENITAIDIPHKLSALLSEKKKRIVSIRGKQSYRLCSNDITQIVEAQKLFDNVFRVTCNDEMKYKPYGFFYELLACMNNFSVAPKTFSKNNFAAFESLDASGFIKSLINFEEREFPHPEDVRFSLFDIFVTMFESMHNTMIYIENIEKMDDTSFEILQMILEKFDKIDVSYIVTADKDFLLHKKCHFLLNSDNYTELRLKQLSIKEMVEKNPQRYKELADSHYLMPIIQGARGSYIFFKNAIDYLSNKGVLEIEKGKISLLQSSDDVLIPLKLTDLMIKRLTLLQEDVPAFELYSRLIMFGPMFDLNVVKYLGVDNGPQGLKSLNSQDFLFAVNGVLYIPEYELVKKAFDRLVPLEKQQELAKDILQKLFVAEVKHPVEARLLKLLENEKQEFIVWENLSKVNASMGDFSAYLNCSIKLLKLLDEKVIDEKSDKTVEDYKMDVYENISNLLYKYTPNEVYNMSKIILKNLEESVNDKKVINMCNKMLQGCLLSGNYSYALELIRKILSKFDNTSMNPDDSNFDVAYFLISLVKIEILFSIGKLKDCVEAGEEILKILKPEKLAALKPEHLSNQQFEDTILDAMSFVGLAKILLLNKEENINSFIEQVKTNVGKTTECFDYFIHLNRILKGQNVDEVKEAVTDNKFSKVLYYIIKSFNNTNTEGVFEKFANDIYQAKINAKLNKLNQIELICDLLIGYSYAKLGKVEKAASIFYNVLDVSQNNGLKFVTYVAMYFISVMKFDKGEYDIALGISNNAIINFEKEDEAGDLLFFLFRLIMSRVFAVRLDIDSAEACMKNAMFLAKKYDIVYDSNDLNQFIEQKKSEVTQNAKKTEKNIEQAEQSEQVVDQADTNNKN